MVAMISRAIGLLCWLRIRIRLRRRSRRQHNTTTMARQDTTRRDTTTKTKTLRDKTKKTNTKTTTPTKQVQYHRKHNEKRQCATTRTTRHNTSRYDKTYRDNLQQHQPDCVASIMVRAWGSQEIKRYHRLAQGL